MADRLTKARRSVNMARIRSKGTKPELTVRRLVYAMGYRYRLHVSGLPGKPDLVFPALRKIILVHGCFWHRHRCAEGQRVPKSRLEYWGPKIAGNTRRDRRNRAHLRRLGWDVLVIWECHTSMSGLSKLQRRLERFLSNGNE